MLISIRCPDFLMKMFYGCLAAFAVRRVLKSLSVLFQEGKRCFDQPVIH